MNKMIFTPWQWTNDFIGKKVKITLSDTKSLIGKFVKVQEIHPKSQAPVIISFQKEGCEPENIHADKIKEIEFQDFSH